MPRINIGSLVVKRVLPFVLVDRDSRKELLST